MGNKRGDNPASVENNRVSFFIIGIGMSEQNGREKIQRVIKIVNEQIIRYRRIILRVRKVPEFLYKAINIKGS